MANDEQVERGRAGGIPEGERLVRIRQLLDAMAACEWDDTERVIVAVLEEARIGAPDTPFGDVDADADADFGPVSRPMKSCGRISSRPVGNCSISN